MAKVLQAAEVDLAVGYGGHQGAIGFRFMAAVAEAASVQIGTELSESVFQLGPGQGGQTEAANAR